MIHIDLSEEERDLLAEVLESYLSDLRYEIADTDTSTFRDQLKLRQAALEKVLSAIRGAAGDT
ncbi:MAG: hypothetical protein D6786_03540 [Gammaproteobacteria bacterium]|nr:MAG: hypothetical protein D6786_03540 [Gammaproteobacteria bacterium]